MRHRKHTFKLGRKQGHRVSLLRNLTKSLFYESQITTTVAKAKECRRLAEKMITLAKDGSLHARRRAIAAMGEAPVVHFLFDEFVADFQERNGGYTRIIRLGQRRGDAAEMCILQLVTGAPESGAAEGKPEAAETSSEASEAAPQPETAKTEEPQEQEPGDTAAPDSTAESEDQANKEDAGAQ